MCLKYSAGAKKWSQVIRSAALVTPNDLSKPEDLMLQNAVSIRKWAPYMSDGHVSCSAPATRHASFQILFKRPTPAIVFETATKPARFAPFGRGRKSIVPACACREKRQLNAQKWSECGVFLTFWLGNLLRTTATCAFSTSHAQKCSDKEVFWATLARWKLVQTATRHLAAKRRERKKH